MNFKSFMLELLEVFIKTKGVFSLINSGGF